MGVSRKGRKPTDLRGLAIPDLVMARLESGLPLKDALMPGASYEGWHSHCKLHPEWAAKAKALVERNAKPGRERKLSHLNSYGKTHCHRGHPLTPENVYVSARKNGSVARSCKQCKAHNVKESSVILAPATIVMLTEAMKRGISYSTIRRRCGAMAAFYRTVRRVPEFGAVHHEWASGGRKRAARTRQRTATDQRYRELMALLPAGMPTKAKIDIIGGIYEAHYSRRYKGKPFGITKAKDRIKDFIADYNRSNPTNSYGDIKTPWSLDAPIYDDGPATLADRATRSIWDEVPL